MGASPFFDEGGLPALKRSHLEENIKQEDKRLSKTTTNSLYLDCISTDKQQGQTV